MIIQRKSSDALLSLPYSGSSSSCVVSSLGVSKISYASVKTAEYYQARKGSNIIKVLSGGLYAAQVYSLISNKATDISEEMLRVPDYYDDMNILTGEDDDEKNFNAQGSSTKKRNLYEEDDDEDSFSDN